MGNRVSEGTVLERWRRVQATRQEGGAASVATEEAQCARDSADSTQLVRVRGPSADARSPLAARRASGCEERGAAFESRVYAATRPGRGDGGGGGIRGRRERDAPQLCQARRSSRTLFNRSRLRVTLSRHTHRLTHPPYTHNTHTHTHNTHTLTLTLRLSATVPQPVGPPHRAAPTPPLTTRAHRQTHTRSRLLPPS